MIDDPVNRSSLATIALLLLPVAAGGEQIDYGIRTQAGWSSNVFGTGDDAAIQSGGQLVPLEEVDDYSMRVSPWARAADFDGDLTWEAQYKPSYEYYLDEDGIRGFDHEAAAQVGWRMGPRTMLFVSDSFRQYRTLLRLNENASSPAESAVLRGDRNEFTGNMSSLTLRHVATPLDELRFSTQYLLRRYETSNDSQSVSVSTSWRHSLDTRSTVGLLGSWSRQTFERVIGDDAETDYYNVSATFDHRFSRTLTLSLSAGPAWIDPRAELVNFSREFGAQPLGANTFLAIDANACPLLNEQLPHQSDPDQPNYNPHLARPGFGGCGPTGTFLSEGELELLGYPQADPLVPGSRPRSPRLTEYDAPFELNANGDLVEFDDSDFGDVTLTYFANFSLRKEWERWQGELAYTRSSDDSGSFGASSVRDTIRGTLVWNATRLWTVSATGGYSLFEQTGDFAVPRFIIVENTTPPAGVSSVSQIAQVQRFVVDVDDDALNYQTWSVSLSANRKLTEHSSVFGAVYWYQQTRTRELDEGLSFIPGVSADPDSESESNNLTVWIGIDWKFDTIRF